MHGLLKSGLAFCRVWHEVDAKNSIVGRLATRIALVLQGKHKPIFTSGNDCGDYVVMRLFENTIKIFCIGCYQCQGFVFYWKKERRETLL